MKKHRDPILSISTDYLQFIEELKARVMSARVSAARAITHEVIFLYWDIGQGIVEKQQSLSWGDSVVETVAADLQEAFPGMRGFSPRNVWDMRRFYSAYSAPEILSQTVRAKGQHWPNQILRQPVAELEEDVKRLQPVANFTADTAIAFLRQLVAETPWGQNLLILNKLTDPAARLWYLRATARFGWSRNVLLNALLNDKERGPGDQPSIGIILCAEKDDVEVEYALRSKTNPIGVAVYQLQSKLPGELKGKLPTAKQLADIVRVVMEGGK